jgi:hypothetical protein
LDFSLRIEATGSHVPHKGLVSVHATSMPDVAQASCRLLLDWSRSNDSSRFRHRPYAFDTFPAVHSLRLPKTSPDAVMPRLFQRRSPPRLLAEAARGGLEPVPADRPEGPTLIPCAARLRSVDHSDLLPAPSWRTVVGVPHEAARRVSLLAGVRRASACRDVLLPGALKVPIHLRQIDVGEERRRDAALRCSG